MEQTGRSASVDVRAEHYKARAVAELRAWLKANPGRLSTEYYAPRFGQLYEAGAEVVWVVEVEECEEAFHMVHTVVVELPGDAGRRQRLLSDVVRLQKHFDLDAEPEIGARYAILWTGE